jgi:hypothetical protein
VTAAATWAGEGRGDVQIAIFFTLKCVVRKESELVAKIDDTLSRQLSG